MKIAIQGALGSFHHEAASRINPETDILTCETFRDVFRAVESGKATHGLCAIENNLYGSISEVYGLLERNNVWITHDIRMRISQNLIGKPGTTLEQLKASADTRVLSQNFALAQTEQWLDEHLPNAQRIETHDTADSVRQIMDSLSLVDMAIAGTFAATTYGAEVIVSDIHDDKDNQTRFLLFVRSRVSSADATQATMILKTDHSPGALLKVLQVFADHGSNLNKLDSHPIPGDERHYAFYIDYDLPEDNVVLVSQLESDGWNVKLLGEYTSVLPSRTLT